MSPNRSESAACSRPHGLYLVVDPSGAKRWLLRIVVQGRRRDLGLGGAGLISLAEAREKALAYRKTARDGGDPLAERRKAQATIPTFIEAAELVHAEHQATWRNPKHAAQWITTLRTYAHPHLGVKRVDQIETEHDLPQVGAVDFVRFKQKARAFLRRHEDHIALHKLRQGKPLTATDLGELERMLLDAGVGDAKDIERARAVSDGFGRFVRSLVGLDRAAVAAAFGEFVSDGSATREQLEFVEMVIGHLASQGVIEPKLLYESPFTDVAPQGPDQLFDEARTVRLFAVIEALNESAVA